MTITPGTTKIGFIGLGVMGRPMAEHVLAAGFELAVFARRQEQAEPLLRRGARSAPTPGALATSSDVIVTIVGMPSDVQSLYFGDEGLIANARPGTTLVDMTTSSPALARRIGRTAEARGVHALDAPVSGGDVGARQARLSVMVGGSPGDFRAALPLLRTFGKTIVRQGDHGAGQHAKLANQIAIAGTMLGLAEALGYASRAALDLPTLLSSISEGAAASSAMTNLAPRMLASDFAPGFFVKHFVKDLGLALDEAEHGLGLEPLVTKLAAERYRALVAAGHENDGTQAIYRLYRDEKPG
jgi:3-hydroxyisobutyrate dehydrogenase